MGGTIRGLDKLLDGSLISIPSTDLSKSGFFSKAGCLVLDLLVFGSPTIACFMMVCDERGRECESDIYIYREKERERERREGGN